MHLLHKRSYCLKKENEQNINSTEKHNSINIYIKSTRFMLLHFRNNSRNAWLDLGKCHSHVIFATKSVPFFVFMSTIVEKDFLQRYIVTNGISISRAFLGRSGKATIWWHKNVESIVVLKSCCWTWLCWSSMISSKYLSMTSALSTLNVNGCLIHVGYDSLFGKYPSRDFVGLSKCKIIACFSSVGTEIFPGTPSISLIQSSNREKLAKLAFFVGRFHSSIFFQKPSDVLPLR